jgi:hypothetical protein
MILKAVARFAGSRLIFNANLGLAPQALCCRSLRELLVSLASRACSEGELQLVANDAAAAV